MLFNLVLFSIATVNAYTLKDVFTSTNILDHFWFETTESTGGYVEYQDQYNAQKLGLVKTTSNKIWIGAEMKSWGKRKSVKLRSNAKYNTGNLMTIELDHMPTGCGTWPAWWLTGPNWPYGGEIDMIETVNTDTADHTTLHTGRRSNGETCVAPGGIRCDRENGNAFTGCGQRGPEGLVGVPFNEAGGGVYALLWDNSGIKTWAWLKKDIPSDITDEKPDPSTWGNPYASFPFGTTCDSSYFKDMQMIINIDFCGNWAGQKWSYDAAKGCSGSCNAYVANPANVKQAYWIIDAIKVYSTPDSGSGSGGSQGTCYHQQAKGNGKCAATNGWTVDTWGEENLDSAADKASCLARKPGNDKYCGTDSCWCFAYGSSKSCGACSTNGPGTKQGTCYFQQGKGNGKCSATTGWAEDAWGKQNANSWASKAACLERKTGNDEYCGTNSSWCYAFGSSESCSSGAATQMQSDEVAVSHNLHELKRTNAALKEALESLSEA